MFLIGENISYQCFKVLVKWGAQINRGIKSLVFLNRVELPHFSLFLIHPGKSNYGEKCLFLF